MSDTRFRACSRGGREGSAHGKTTRITTKTDKDKTSRRSDATGSSKKRSVLAELAEHAEIAAYAELDASDHRTDGGRYQDD